MSFILNALRKSEQERLSNHAETLEDKILVKQGATKKNKSGLGLLIMINLLLLAFFLWHYARQEEEGIAKNSVMVAEQSKASVQIKPGKLVKVAKQAESQVQIKQEEPVTVSEQVKAPDQKKEEKTIQVQDSKSITTPQVTINQQIKNLQKKKKESHKRQSSLRTDQIIQPVKVSQPFPNEVKSSNVAEEVQIQKPDLVASNKDNEPPYLLEMPYEFRLSVPNININVFVYLDQPGDRFIMVNMQKYQVGQQIIKDMELKEIRPDSIVVEYKGKVFQIQR